MWTVPKAVIVEFIRAAEAIHAGSSQGGRVTKSLLDRLSDAIKQDREPAETSLSREELEKLLGRNAKFENTQLARVAIAAGRWIEFSVEERGWWGRLIGPTAVVRGDSESGRLYFVPEVFPSTSVMRFRRRQSEDEVPGIESLSVLAGDPDDLAVSWLFPLLSSAKQIDLVNSYRVNEWVRTKLDAFRRRERREGDRAHLRACFMDVRDRDLMTIFARKIGQERIDVIQERVRESIEKTLLAKSVQFQGHRLQVELGDGPSEARVSAYFTPMRLTYLYWRVDHRAIIVPLDMKKPQDLKPVGWAISQESCKQVFDYYASDAESLFVEENLVYSTPA